MRPYGNVVIVAISFKCQLWSIWAAHTSRIMRVDWFRQSRAPTHSLVIICLHKHDEEACVVENGDYRTWSRWATSWSAGTKCRYAVHLYVHYRFPITHLTVLVVRMWRHNGECWHGNRAMRATCDELWMNNIVRIVRNCSYCSTSCIVTDCLFH